MKRELISVKLKKEMLKIKIKDKPTSMNKFWEAPHWSFRKKVQDGWASILIPIFKSYNVDIKKIAFPIRVAIYSCSPRPLDSDNILAKPIIDALKHAWKIDDNYKYIRKTSTETAKAKEEYTLIIIKDEDD